MMNTRNFKTREGYDIWDKLCAIPKYGFLIGPSGGIVKVLDIGNWIDRGEAQSVVDDAQAELNETRADALAGYAVRDARIAELRSELVRQAIDNNQLRAELAALNAKLDASKFCADVADDLRAELAAIKAQGVGSPIRLWIIGDAGQKKGATLCKKSSHDGSLAFFETEEDAARAAKRHAGTAVYSVDYYKSAQVVMPDKQMVLSRAVGLASRMPGAGDWCVAEFTYDEISSHLNAAPEQS